MSWRVFTGSGQPHDGLKNLPPAPPWRSFGHNQQPSYNGKPPVSPEEDRRRGESFQVDEEDEKDPESYGLVAAVNAALHLRRPLLITGKPGIGKSSIIYAVAHELQMGPVLRWPITSRTTLQDGLYHYDALGRLQAQQTAQQEAKDIGNFIELGPLGTAFLPSDWPRALLIDEIDKGDLDLPNDLLNIFEEGEFTIRELARLKRSGPAKPFQVWTWKTKEKTSLTEPVVKCRQFPFIVMTSNNEREFPAPFHRRCIRVTIQEPNPALLARIVRSHLDGNQALDGIEGLIQHFLDKRRETDLATDQLLNAACMVLDPAKGVPGEDRTRLLNLLLRELTGQKAT